MRSIGDMKKTKRLDAEVVDLFVRSRVYLDYAEKFMGQAYIDKVDEQAILSIK
jgi:hypothetical protein